MKPATWWSRIFGVTHGKFAAPLAYQLDDLAYAPLRDGLINPLNDTFDIHIPLAEHLEHQHGDPHGR